MKKLLTILLAITLISLTSCGKSNNSPTQPTTDEPSITITTPSEDNPTTTNEEKDETANMELTLKIDGIEVDVIWADNDSVKALKNLAKDGLTINSNYKAPGLNRVSVVLPWHTEPLIQMPRARL